MGIVSEQELPPGRELDALIALQVFRYVLDYEFAETFGAPTVRELRDQYDEWGILPCYSTDMTDAWQVADAIHARMTNIAGDGGRGDINFLTLCVLSRYGATAASFAMELQGEWWEDADTLPFSARGVTPAHAICRAALATLRETL
jgi:hypothetical protein